MKSRSIGAGAGAAPFAWPAAFAGFAALDAEAFDAVVLDVAVTCEPAPEAGAELARATEGALAAGVGELPGTAFTESLGRAAAAAAACAAVGTEALAAAARGAAALPAAGGGAAATLATGTGALAEAGLAETF